MSAVENSLVLRFLPREGQEPPLLNLLPNEILDYLLSFVVTSETPWNHIVQYLLVCKQFSLLIKGIDRYKIWYTLTRASLPIEISPTLEKEIKEVALLNNKGRFAELSRVCVNKVETCYWRCEDDSNLHILSSSADGFQYSTIDIKGALQSTCSDALQKHGINFNEDAFTIRDCHVTQKGFIVVLSVGVSRWEYDSSHKPKCLSFYSPFIYDHIKKANSAFVTQSTYKSGVLYLTALEMRESVIKNVYKIDLNQEKPQFNKLFIGDLNIPDSHYFALWPAPNGLLLTQYWKDKNLPVRINKIKVSDDGKVMLLEDKGLEMVDVFGLTIEKATNKLILVAQNCNSFRGPVKKLFIYDSESLALLIGKEMDLDWPEHDYDSIFFMKDFLCLFYFPNRVRIIHVPTKKEYTKQLAPFLRLFGEVDGLHLETSSTDNSLHILWQDRKPDGNFVLKSLQVPLQLQETLPLSSAPNSLSCDHKIVIIAGAALALIALITTLALAFTYSGAPLLETNGFTLTVPTVVTFVVGETTALVVVSLGIYLRKRK